MNHSIAKVVFAAAVGLAGVLGCSRDSNLGTTEEVVSAVDASYRFTGTTYAFSSGDGILTIENPCLGRKLVIDSSNYMDPKRTESTIPAAGNAACIAARAGL